MDIMARIESMKAWTHGILSQSKNQERNGMQACMHGKIRKQGNVAHERTLKHEVCMHGTMTHRHINNLTPLDGKAINGMQACMHTQLASGGHKGLCPCALGLRPPPRRLKVKARGPPKEAHVALPSLSSFSKWAALFSP